MRLGGLGFGESFVTTLDIVLSILAVPVSVANAYLLSLTLLSWRRPSPAYGAPELKFAIVVPAVLFAAVRFRLSPLPI